MSSKISLSRYLVEQQRDKGHIPAEFPLPVEVVGLSRTSTSPAVPSPLNL